MFLRSLVKSPLDAEHVSLGRYDESLALRVDDDDRPVVLLAGPELLGTETKALPGDRDDPDVGRLLLLTTKTAGGRDSDDTRGVISQLVTHTRAQRDPDDHHQRRSGAGGWGP